MSQGNPAESKKGTLRGWGRGRRAVFEPRASTVPREGAWAPRWLVHPQAPGRTSFRSRLWWRSAFHLALCQPLHTRNTRPSSKQTRKLLHRRLRCSGRRDAEARLVRESLIPPHNEPQPTPLDRDCRPSSSSGPTTDGQDSQTARLDRANWGTHPVCPQVVSSPPFSSGSGWFPGQPWGCGCLALCAGRRADIVVNGRLRGPCVCQAELSIARCRAEVRNGRTWALNFSMPLALQRETLPVVLAARHRGFRRVLSVESALAGVVGLTTVTGEDGGTFQYEMMERSLVLTLTVPGGASYMLPTWTARFRTRANILLTSCLTAEAEQFSHPRQSQYAFRFVKSLRVHDVVGDEDLPGGSNRRPAWRGTDQTNRPDSALVSDVTAEEMQDLCWLPPGRPDAPRGTHQAATFGTWRFLPLPQPAVLLLSSATVKRPSNMSRTG